MDGGNRIGLAWVEWRDSRGGLSGRTPEWMGAFKQATLGVRISVANQYFKA